MKKQLSLIFLIASLSANEQYQIHKDPNLIFMGRMQTALNQIRIDKEVTKNDDVLSFFNIIEKELTETIFKNVIQFQRNQRIRLKLEEYYANIKEIMNNRRTLGQLEIALKYINFFNNAIA
ncbi:MAG: hypothetical protein FADNKDHG_01310 [Holosporales bacterium]